MSTTTASPLPQTGNSNTLREKTLGLVSLIAGLVSMLAGFTLIVPLGGLVAGIVALRREPSSRGLAIWGIVLNSLALVGGVIVAVGIVVAFAGAGLEAILPN